jgi:hypothetical protein
MALMQYFNQYALGKHLDTIDKHITSTVFMMQYKLKRRDNDFWELIDTPYVKYYQLTETGKEAIKVLEEYDSLDKIDYGMVLKALNGYYNLAIINNKGGFYSYRTENHMTGKQHKEVDYAIKEYYGNFPEGAITRLKYYRKSSRFSF